MNQNIGNGMLRRAGLATLVAALALPCSTTLLASHAGVSRVDNEDPNEMHVAPKALNGIVPFAVTGNLKYYGGKVIPNVKIYQVNYGTGTYIPEVAGTQMGAFYQQVTNSAYMDWQSEYNTVGVVPQDGGASSNQTIGRGSFAGKIAITPNSARNGSTITDAQIQTELKAQITAGVLPMPDANTLYMVHFPAGKTISQGGSNSCASGGFCAYHGTVPAASPIPEFYYGVMPDMSASSGCASGCGSSTTFNNQTSVASHEVFEAITDAEVGIGTTVSRPLAWYDTTNGENGDICNAQQGTIVGTDGVTYTVQKLWSNHYGACIVTPPTASNDFSISVTPSSQTVTAGGSTSYTLSTAVTSGSAQTLSLSVTGLPTGASASFNPTSVTAGSSDTMTVATTSSTPAGTYVLTVRGTAGSGSHTATTTLVVNPTGGSTLPESAHNYANNYDNTWTYTLAGSPASINVTFDALTKVESGYDYIYVMNGSGVNIAGSPFTSTTLAGATKNVIGSTVKIRLTSDGSVVYYGFKVTSVTAAGAGDTTLPTTSITAPANGATVSGSVNVTASASDNVGVTKLEIYVDGALKTSNTNATSLTYAWGTTTVANGSHTLTSKAYDAAGNVGTSSTVTVTVSNTTTTTQLLGNPGFENGATTAPWTTTSGVADNGSAQAAHSGSWKAWMNGYGSAHTDSILQTVAIPASTTTATLSFYLHIDTAETGTTAYDTLKVQIRNSSGTVLATLATYSNANAAAGYSQKSFNVSTYKGQTIQVYVVGVEDSTKQTSFVLDDFALNVN